MAQRVEPIMGMPISSWTVARETWAARALNLLPSMVMVVLEG
jgi:hypothetical protein